MGESDDWSAAQRVEGLHIATRRRWLRSKGWHCPTPVGTVGLALAGGGIRSATFSLGLLRSLSKRHLLPSVDYISSVSGGGYAAAYYCSLFVPPEMRGPKGAPGKTVARDCRLVASKLTADVFGSDNGRASLTQLRQGGYYLAPNGMRDALFAGVIAVRNWMAVALVTGLSLLALFLAIDFVMIFFRSLLTALNHAAWTRSWLPRVPTDELMGPWLATLFVLSLWPLTCAWAFWFARHHPVPRRRLSRLRSWQTIVALLIAVAASGFIVDIYPAGWPQVWRFTLTAASLGAFFVYAMAEYLCFTASGGGGGVAVDDAAAVAEEDAVRSRLNRWLFKGAALLLTGALLAAVAWAGRKSHLFVESSQQGLKWPKLSATVALFTATALPVSRWLLKTPIGQTLQTEFWKTLTRRLGTISATAIGLLLLAIFLTFWSALGYAVMWDVLPLDPFKAGGSHCHTIAAFGYVTAPYCLPTHHWVALAWRPLVLLGVLGLCAILLGLVDSLLNGSSLAAFYASRLRKAYLGATNVARWGTADAPVDKDDPADEIKLSSYYHPAVLAPVHIVNVTINETTSRSSRVIQRDRKGKPLALTPAGILYPAGAASDSLSCIGHCEGEDLPLSSWIAISGAAVSTGAGQHSSLGTAILASMTNMRLGYWWYSKPVSRWRRWRRRYWVQSYLMRELRTSYEGSCAERWYLSDGGHHENTGVYELARRRVPFIIASDNGSDPRYEFGDLVNLIRKLRIDHEAEIEFLDDDELDNLFGETPLRDVFGTLERIKARGEAARKAAEDSRSKPAAAGPYAAIGRIRYPRYRNGKVPAPSTLIWIKPRITGKELPDLLQYRDANLSFPQQPTTDQFFDEAQWESYFRLGQLIGDAIFDKDRFAGALDERPWWPWHLIPLPDRIQASRSGK